MSQSLEAGWWGDSVHAGTGASAAVGTGAVTRRALVSEIGHLNAPGDFWLPCTLTLRRLSTSLKILLLRDAPNRYAP